MVPCAHQPLTWAHHTFPQVPAGAFTCECSGVSSAHGAGRWWGGQSSSSERPRPLSHAGHPQGLTAHGLCAEDAWGTSVSQASCAHFLEWPDCAVAWGPEPARALRRAGAEARSVSGGEHAPRGPLTPGLGVPGAVHACLRAQASFPLTHGPCSADPGVRWTFPRALVGTPHRVALRARCRSARPRRCRPGGAAAFPGRKLRRRKQEVESHDPSVLGALPSGKPGTRAEPSWKICCNHYLCSLSIMRVTGPRERPADCVNTAL